MRYRTRQHGRRVGKAIIEYHFTTRPPNIFQDAHETASQRLANDYEYARNYRRNADVIATGSREYRRRITFQGPSESA